MRCFLEKNHLAFEIIKFKQVIRILRSKMTFRVSNLIIILAMTYVLLPCALAASKFDSEVNDSIPSDKHEVFQESREDIKEIINFLTHLMTTGLHEKNLIELEIGDKR